jgi:hypothetical protein
MSRRNWYVESHIDIFIPEQHVLNNEFYVTELKDFYDYCPHRIMKGIK